MNTIELPIKNFPAQDTIFNDTARFRIVVKGRRFGLTKGKANDFIRGALEGRFKKGLWVDVVNSNIDKYVDRYFIPVLKLLPQGMWDWHKQNRVLRIRDSYIDFRSADRPESIEGFGYDDVFLNEAGIILKNEYLWNNAIRPMLWEYQAPAVIGGTPKGAGLFKNLAELGKNPEQPMYSYHHFTTFDNPYIDQYRKEIEEEMRSMPDLVKRQEIFADFISDTGVVFKNVSHIATAAPKKPEAGHLYVMGVDLAKVEDYTVITVYDRQTNSQVYQDRFNIIEWPFQKKKIQSIATHYNHALVRLDATGIGDPIADDLLRSGLSVEPVKLTNESKKEIIEKMSIWIEQELVHVINLPETISEFNNFTYDITSSGRIRYNAPVGFHDDIVISHCLAVSGLSPLPKGKNEKEKTPIQEAYAAARYGNTADEFDYIAV